MSPHDGAAITELLDKPRWKCGEIYTWNNAELYAVECSLCDDKIFCTLEEFAEHMQDCHRSWECVSDDGGDCVMEGPTMETEPPCQKTTQQWYIASAQEESGAIYVGLHEEEEFLEEIKVGAETVEQSSNIANNIKEKGKSCDRMWRRMLISEATADDTQILSRTTAPSSNQLKTRNHIVEGQEPRGSFEEVLIENVVLVAKTVEGTGEEEKIEVAEKLLENENSFGTTVNTTACDHIMTSKKQQSIAFTENSCESLLANNSGEEECIHKAVLSVTEDKQSNFAEDNPRVEKLSSDQVVLLIELYKEHPRLWNPSLKEFSDTDLCRESWEKITKKFNKACKHFFKINELKIRISSLCQRYRAEKHRISEELSWNGSVDENNLKFRHYTALQFLDDQPDAMQSRRIILHKQNLKIIEIYKRFPILWHTASKYKLSPTERAQALEKISEALQLDNIYLSSKSVQRRLHALHKFYRKEKVNYLHCLREKRKFRTNFKHYEQMKFLQKHIAPYVCKVCGRIFEKLHEHTEHINNTHDDVMAHQNEEEENEEELKKEELKPKLIAENIKPETATNMLATEESLDNNPEENIKMEHSNHVNDNQQCSLAATLNQNNSANEDAGPLFKEPQEKLLMDGLEVDKFLANLLEREPFMEIAAEIFNETKSSDEKMQKMPFEFPTEFDYAMDDMIQQNSNGAEVVLKTADEHEIKNIVVSAYEVANAMITQNFSQTPLNSPTQQLFTPPHRVLNSPQHVLNSSEHVINKMEHGLASPTHSLESQQEFTSAHHVLNSPSQYFNSSTHLVNSPHHILNSTRNILSPSQNVINNNIGNTINSSPYTISVSENTFNMIREPLNNPDIYFNTHDNSLPDSKDTLEESQDSIKIVHNAINESPSALDTDPNLSNNAAVNLIHDVIIVPQESLQEQNIIFTQNEIDISQNHISNDKLLLQSSNAMDVLQTVQSVQQHSANALHESFNFSQNNIKLAQYESIVQENDIHVSRNFNHALNSSNPTVIAQHCSPNSSQDHGVIIHINSEIDNLPSSSQNSSTLTAPILAPNNNSSSINESLVNLKRTDLETVAATKLKKQELKTDFKNLTLRLKKTFTTTSNQSEEEFFDSTSQDSHIQCEVYITENDNNDSIDCIPLLPSVNSSRLSEEQTHHLIGFYREQALLWNPHHKQFNCKSSRHIAWKNITIAFNRSHGLRIQWQTVYKKLTDIVKYYRKEKERVTSQDVTSKWCYYNDFKFLDEYLDLTSDIHKTLQEKELNLKIIKIYKTFPQLWNTHLQEYKRRSQRNRHIDAMHNSLQEEANIQISLEKLKRKLLEFRCSFRQEKEKRIECAQNNEAFESFYEYYKDLEFLEPHISPFICQVCNVSSTKLTEIMRHYRATKHQKISKKRIHLKTSEKSPESDIKHICHICGAEFTMRNNLMYHLNRHLGKRTHMCNMCPKSFYNSTSLHVHERSHTKEYPFICEQCGQKFVNNSKLNQHRKRHNNQRDFHCDQCGKDFYSAFERDKHTKRHLQIRDQVCPICGKAFVSGSSIYTHMELHNEVKKYACKLCDKRFSQNSGLYRHMKKHNIANDS